MSANDYNDAQPITGAQLSELTWRYQLEHADQLTVDGQLGPKTRKHIDDHLRVWPMPALADGREPVVSSDGWWRNPSRDGRNGTRRHDGLDLMYDRLPADTQPTTPGEGAKWFICPVVECLAAATGRVTQSKQQKNGGVLWIEHMDGKRSGYFHLASRSVQVGEWVFAGSVIGVVGAGKKGPRHLHFEVSPATRYQPEDPQLWLSGAWVVSANAIQ